MTLAMNFVLAILWASLIGPFTPLNILVGFVIGFAIIAVIGIGGEGSAYVRRVTAAGTLMFYTLYELIVANLKVAWWTVASLRNLKPAILAVPLEEDLTDWEITLFSVLLTLTPGTLMLDVSTDRKAIFVHFMHVDDADEAIRSLKSGFERRILEVMR